MQWEYAGEQDLLQDKKSPMKSSGNQADKEAKQPPELFCFALFSLWVQPGRSGPALLAGHGPWPAATFGGSVREIRLVGHEVRFSS